MDRGPAVGRGDPDGRVLPAGGGAADEKRQPQPGALHLGRHVDHLVQGGGDEAAQADHVGLLLPRGLEDPVGADHHPQVDDVAVVAAQDDPHDVLADVVDVPLHRGQDDPGPAPRGRSGPPFRLHQRLQDRHRLLHHPGALHDLGKEHLPLAEEIAHHAHPGHERPLDDGEGSGMRLERLGDVAGDVLVDPPHQGVLQPLLQRLAAPRVVPLAPLRRRLLHPFGERHQPLGGVGCAVEENVLHPLPQVGRNLVVDGELPGIDDPHVHAGADGVVEEGGVHRLPDGVVPPEGEGEVAHAAADFREGEAALQLPGRLQEGHRVAVVLLDAGADGEDAGVEDDVGGIEADLLRQDPVGPGEDLHLAPGGDRLSLLVEGHDHHRGAVAADEARLAPELLLPLLEADGVHDPLSLQALEPRLQHGEPRAVQHDGEPGDLRLRGDEVQEGGHRLLGVEEPLVHVHVQNVRASLHLLPRHRQRLLHPVVPDEAREAAGSGDVGPLADQDEIGVGPDRQGLQAAEAGQGGRLREAAGRQPLHGIRHGADVLGGGAAAAPHQVQPPFLRVVLQDRRHLLGGLVVASLLVGEAGVREAVDPQGGDPGDLLQVGAHLRPSQGAVEPHAEQPGVADGDPGRLQGLSREGAAAPVGDGEGGRHRDADPGVVEGALDGEEGRLEVQRVEAGLRQEQVHAPQQEPAGRVVVGPLQVVEPDGPEPRIVHPGGEGRGPVGGAHGAGHEPGAAGGPAGFRVGGPPGDLRRGPVDGERLLLQSVVGEGDGGGGEGVGLDDVGARPEEPEVDLLDDLRPGQREDVVAPLEVAGMVPEPPAAEPRLVQAPGLDHGPHGAVQDQDPAAQQPFELFASAQGVSPRIRDWSDSKPGGLPLRHPLPMLSSGRRARRSVVRHRARVRDRGVTRGAASSGFGVGGGRTGRVPRSWPGLKRRGRRSRPDRRPLSLPGLQKLSRRDPGPGPGNSPLRPGPILSRRSSRICSSF